MSASTPARRIAAGPAPGAALWRRAAGPIRPDWATLAYTLRTMLAIGLALYTAFTLQLLSPMSSVTTVLIVANPVTGALVSKSLWRLFGTVLGAATAVVLFALFAQSPLLFTAALALCIGIACMVSSLLRYFRAYAAVLAGYTIIIVAAGSFADPQNIFIGALSRVSSVSVGLLGAALVFLLTSVKRPRRLDDTIGLLVRDVAAAFLVYREPRSAWPEALPRGDLLRRTNALDELIEYAAADSALVGRRRQRLRLGAARLLGLLGMLVPLHDRLAPVDPDVRAARHLVHETMTLLAAGEPGGLAAVLPRIEAARDEAGRLADRATTPDALAVLLHEHDLLLQLARCIADLTGTGPAAVRIRRVPLFETPTALRNGLRGALVTLIGGVFWYATQWSSGPVLLSFLIPGACLLSTNPSASQASVRFATGTLLAIPMAAFFEIMLLPRITGFPLLWLTLCLCLAPGIWLQFHPRHGLRAFGYVVFFNAMVGVRNPVGFDDVGLLNTWLAFGVGAFCLVAVFRLLLPTNPSREVRRLCRSLNRAVARLAAGRPRPLPAPAWENWQNQQMQKILRLAQRLQQRAASGTVPAGGPAPEQVMQSAFALVALGGVVRDLHALDHAFHEQAPGPATACRAAVRDALEALRRTRPDRLPDAARLQAEALSDPDPDPRAFHILVGALDEAVLLLAEAGPVLRAARGRDAASC